MAVEKWGLVTSVQRFSLNDGPGIRTTVFLKGCNLHCAWCHNPETIRPENELLADPARCIGCGHCTEVCPTGAHAKIGERIVFDRSRCNGCGSCAQICFPGAMEMAARRRSVGEILGEIAQDRDYYRDSGGGVTLSGGEVFCQPGFAEALIDGCRAAGFPVAVETNLAYPFEPVRPILEKTDLIMFDLKLFDSEAHRKWTGSGNGQILENARRLEELEIPLIARTPLVPGVTDSEENIEAIAGFLAGFRRLRCYELLNFNPLGDPKYRALGRENPFREARPLPPERVETLRRLAAGRNLVVKAG